MKDIQNQRDYRRINIKKVGVKNISYPITVLDKARRVQKTVATVNMYVNLPHSFKGTHMSRFIEILNRFHGNIDLESFQHILEEMKDKLEAQAAHIEIDFPYFLNNKRQHYNAIGIGEYHCKMHGSLDEEYDLSLEIRVPISPPIPSQSDAALPRSLGHWGCAKICLRFRHFIWMEDLIQMVEEVIGINRKSGKIPTANKAENAALEINLSVEEITRALGDALMKHPDIRWFSIRVENLSEGYSMFSTLEWTTHEINNVS